jgi:hypothetical protein
MKSTKHFLSAAISIALALAFFGCSSNDGDSCTQTGIINGPSVNYGGETYESVVICGQTWLKRNLNYNASSSVCYDNNQSNCTKYGRL